MFLLSLAFFVERGPYRAIRYSTTGDFSTVYSAARSWMAGNNPYDQAVLKRTLARAGAPEGVQHDQDINPSVYLPSALSWTALIAWLPWNAANGFWCLLSVALFGLSLWTILKSSNSSSRNRWLLASAALLFSPTYVGVYDGNPSVLSISLVALAICWAIERATLKSGVALGIALCFKPQIAICALAVLALWRRWPAILVALAVFSSAMSVGVAGVSHLGQTWAWWHNEQRNVALSFQSGGQSDPSPTSHVAWQLLNTQTLLSYFVPNRWLCDWLTWALVALLATAFLRRRHSGPNWQDVAFCSASVLMLTYHRYYDAQLLLMAIPLLSDLWRRRRSFSFLLITTCLLALASPLQSVFVRKLGADAEVASLQQVILLRLQPAAVLMLAIVFAFVRVGCEHKVTTAEVETRT